MGQPWSLFCLLCIFSNKQYKFYNKLKWEVHIRWWELNPHPLENEPSPITTRPGLSSECYSWNFFLCNSCCVILAQRTRPFVIASLRIETFCSNIIQFSVRMCVLQDLTSPCWFLFWNNCPVWPSYLSLTFVFLFALVITLYAILL